MLLHILHFMMVNIRVPFIISMYKVQCDYQRKIGGGGLRLNRQYLFTEILGLQEIQLVFGFIEKSKLLRLKIFYKRPFGN